MRQVPRLDRSMLPLDLSSTTVFLDFDGTITQHDSCVHLLNRTAGDSWRVIETTG